MVELLHVLGVAVTDWTDWMDYILWLDKIMTLQVALISPLFPF